MLEVKPTLEVFMTAINLTTEQEYKTQEIKQVYFRSLHADNSKNEKSKLTVVLYQFNGQSGNQTGHIQEVKSKIEKLLPTETWLQSHFFGEVTWECLQYFPEPHQESLG